VAITIVGVGAVDSASPWAPTIAGPVLADDIVLLLVEQASLTTPEASPTATGGFAHVLGSPVGPDTTGTVLSVLWMRAAGGETATTVTGPSNHAVTRTITLRGVKATGNPWNVNPAVTLDTASTTSVTWPAVTPTATDCLICLCIATGTDTSAAQVGTVTNANLTSITERMDNWAITGTGGGIGLVTGFRAPASSTGTSTMTLTAAAPKALMTMALEPAAAPADVLPLKSRHLGRRDMPPSRARYGS
jgi:hypothetical protein